MKPNYHAGCAGKVQFADRQSASDVAFRGVKDGGARHAYRCCWCNGWHVGEDRGKTAATLKAKNKRARLLEEAA